MNSKPIEVTEKIGNAQMQIFASSNYDNQHSALKAILLSLLFITCGVWCLLAAFNVKKEAEMFQVADENENPDKDRSDAGSEFSIEIEKEVKGKKQYFTGLSKSLLIFKRG